MAADLLSRLTSEEVDPGPDCPLKGPQDEEGVPNKAHTKQMNGYHAVNVAGDEETESRDCTPGASSFDAVNGTFVEEDDPTESLEVYKHIRADVDAMRHNIDAVTKLRDDFNLSDSQKQYQSIMSQLDELMMDNSRLTRKIKKRLKEEKTKNDKLSSAADRRSSSILQWRVNQLNSSIRHFKTVATEFQIALKTTQSALKQKEKRKLKEFAANELTEEKMDYMVDNPAELESFLKNKWAGVRTADALLDRVVEIEDRHQGMLKIEKSIKELHELWMELNVMVSEQQEHLDRVEANVEETKNYVTKGVLNLEKGEKKQKSARKLKCCAVCMLLIIVIIVAIVFGGIIPIF